MIMFKDIKAKLKIATNELENLKKRIAGDLFRSNIKIDTNENIDDQDKTFISQVFMQMTYKPPTALHKKMTTKEHSNVPKLSFFYSKYGLQNLNKVLESIGTNWNFDIWFLFQATGQSIFVISKFVCNKYGLCEEFMIEDEVFDKFFSTLEKVKNI